MNTPTTAAVAASSATSQETLQRDMANALRALAMDAVQAANSGHPGMPMGMAEIALALWSRHLRHNPSDPHWADRDRFMLSNGHGSMLLYGLLHLTGYDLPIDELKRFRQLGSKTPGHPEYGCTPGAETTTGPLGQGVANGVGMAIAERVLAAHFNQPGFDVVDHHTYVFMGDGCMMEGVSHEACALAGTLGLGKLIVFYDDNGISIDSEKGHIEQWYTDNVPERFKAYGWQVIPRVDGHDVAAVDKAIRKAKREKSRPTLICCKTVIGKGAPHKQNTGAAHGSPLGADEVAATREAIGWPYPPFEIPQRVYEAWNARAAGARRQKRWNKLFADYQAAHPELAGEFRRRMAGELPAEFDALAAKLVHDCDAKAETIATRKASQNLLEALQPDVAGIGRRIGGPRPFQPHARQGLEGDRAYRRRQLPVLRRARVRHVRHHERPVAARRPGALRRHLPHLFGLRAQRAAHGRADRHARDLRVHARLDRLGRGRADAPADRAGREPAPDSRTWRSGVRATRSRPRSPGARRSSARMGRRRCCFHARTSPLPGATRRRSRAFRAAATCCRRAPRRRGWC